MKKSLTLFVFCISIFNFYAHSQTEQLCDRKGPTISNDRIMLEVYSTVRIAKQKGLPESVLTKLEKDYGVVRKEFNDLYLKMSKDLSIFDSRRKICQKYSGEIEGLITKAKRYNQSVYSALNVSPPASVGVDDIIQIIDWIWKLGEGLEEIRQKQFYKALEWMEWKEI
jgi:hypothetical protein